MTIPNRIELRHYAAAIIAPFVKPLREVMHLDERFVSPILAHLPEGSFRAIVTGDSVVRGKPHPEPYLTAAAALGARAPSCSRHGHAIGNDDQSAHRTELQGLERRPAQLISPTSE